MYKSELKRLFAKLGYSITKIRIEPKTAPKHVWAKDPFLDLAQLISEISNPVIFDVGAHHGHTCLRFRSVIPHSKIYAFEPFLESFEALKANTARDCNIIPFCFGFAEVQGNRDFCSNSHSPANSLLETDSRGHETWGPCVLDTQEHVSVAFEKVDDFVRDNDLKYIDVLKLDCQGSEPLVVEGAKQSLLNKVVKVIYTEIIIQPTYIGQKSFHDSLKMYENLGYTLFNLYGLQETSNGFLRQIDAIFIPKE